MTLALLAVACTSASKNIPIDAPDPENTPTEQVETVEEVEATEEAQTTEEETALAEEAAVAAEEENEERPQTAVMPPEWSPQVIRAGSLLNIHVYVAGNREVDISNARVSENGTITLPIIGPFSIAGESLLTAKQTIQSQYENYFVAPQVTVDIVRDDDSDSFPWGFVTVLGRVKRQGRVAIPPTRDLTVTSAIQQAGGFDTSARITAIRVTRRLPDGKSQTFDVNMRRIGRRGRTEQDIPLKPNDVVFIPETLF